MNSPQGLPLTGWIREKQLLALKVIPYQRTKMREEIAAGRFPAPRQFSPRLVAYDCAAIHEWINAQSALQPEVQLARRGTRLEQVAP